MYPPSPEIAQAISKAFFEIEIEITDNFNAHFHNQKKHIIFKYITLFIIIQPIFENFLIMQYKMLKKHKKVLQNHELYDHKFCDRR